MLVYLGFAGGIVLAVVGMVSPQNTAACMIGGIFLALNGVVANALLQSFSEVIRLLKKQNGMAYGGSISLAHPVYRYICSKCGRNQEHAVSRCWSCGESFDTTTPEGICAKIEVAGADFGLPQPKVLPQEEHDRLTDKLIVVSLALLALMIVTVLAVVLF